MWDLLAAISCILLLKIFRRPTLPGKSASGQTGPTAKRCRVQAGICPPAVQSHPKVFINQVQHLCISNSASHGVHFDWGSTPVPTHHQAEEADARQKRQLRDPMGEEQGLTDIIQRLDVWRKREEDNKEQFTVVIEALKKALKQKSQKLTETQQQLKAAEDKAQQEIDEEKEKMVTFVLRLEQRDHQISKDVVSKLKDDDLRQVAARLIEKYNVRILAIDCGLNIKLDVPESQILEVVQQQHLMQEDLKNFLCVQSAITWRPMERCQLDRSNTLLLHSPIPVSTPGDELEVDSVKNKLTRRKSGNKHRSVQTPTQRTRSSVSNLGSCDISDGLEKHDCPEDEKNRIDRVQKQYIESLERELAQLKGHGHTGVGVRKDEDRLITLSQPFRSPQGSSSQLATLVAAAADVDARTVDCVAQQLQNQLHVKLVGVLFPCCGSEEDAAQNRWPTFILKTSMAHWAKIKEEQGMMHHLLGQLLPSEDIQWQETSVGFPRNDADSNWVGSKHWGQMKSQAEGQYAATKKKNKGSNLGWDDLWFSTNAHLSALSTRKQKMVDWWRKVLRSEGAPIGERKPGPKINPRIPRFQLLECCQPPPVPLCVLLDEARKAALARSPIKVASISTVATTVDTDSGRPQAVVLAVVPDEPEFPTEMDLGHTDSEVSLSGTILEQLLGTAARIQEAAPGTAG